MRIDRNKFVSLSYDLYVGEDGKEELMEKTTTESPLEFIYGTNMMLEAFENELSGLEAGSHFDFYLSPEQAYGEYFDDRVIDIPIAVFSQDGKVNYDLIKEGNIVPMADAAGNRLNGSVVSVNDETVKMDFNHPLAGERLHFSGEILNVREATAEEIANLFAEENEGCGCGGGCGCGTDEGSNGCSCN